MAKSILSSDVETVESNRAPNVLLSRLQLNAIEEVCRPGAIKAFLAGDGAKFANAGYSRHATLQVVADNASLLRARGIFEQALIAGYMGCKINHHEWPIGRIRKLFESADRTRLLRCGGPLPGEGPFHVYRGVSGHERYKNGISWTNSLDVACWFAGRFDTTRTAVYEGIVARNEVFCYVVERNEQELICYPHQINLLAIPAAELEQRAGVITASRAENNRRRLAEMRKRLT